MINENNLGSAQDVYLQKMKAAKSISAVVKVDFATFASTLPEDVNIFAYEGPADKCLYYHWIKRISGGLKYEPYVGKNKRKVLQLFDLLQEDKTGLGNRVFFFVDRDFDGLQGRLEHKKIFVTEAYSIENYVVCPGLLDDLLKIEFHCNGYPTVRKEISDQFQKVYDQFLEVTAEINFRIFIARKRQINQIGDLPDRINQLARVEVTSVSSIDSELRELVCLEREPTEEEVQNLRPYFEKIEPRTGYRGKFALLFFIKWLGQLRENRQATSSSLFGIVPKPEFAITGNFSLETLAPKASAPAGLSEFLAQIS